MRNWLNPLSRLGGSFQRSQREKNRERLRTRRLFLEPLEERRLLIANHPPFLAPISPVTVEEKPLAPVFVDLIGSDVDPADVLTYRLEPGAPGFVTLVGNQLKIDPDYNDGPQTYNVAVSVVDNGGPNYAYTRLVPITVEDKNRAPILNLPEAIEIDEGTTLEFGGAATDEDPEDRLTYRIIREMAMGPINMPLDHWQKVRPPTTLDEAVAFSQNVNFDEASGPGSYRYRVYVYDNHPVGPPFVVSRSMDVTVREVNLPPTIEIVSGNFTPEEHEEMKLQVRWSDPDLPANILTASVKATTFPAGWFFDASTGLFTFTPDEHDGGASYEVTFEVTDNQDPELKDEITAYVNILETNTPPEIGPVLDAKFLYNLAGVPDQAYKEFEIAATDSDLPAQQITFTAVATSGDVSTTPITVTPLPNNRALIRIPAPSIAVKSYRLVVTATDNGDPPLSDSDYNVIMVGKEVEICCCTEDPPGGNDPPIIIEVGTYTINVGDDLALSPVYDDPDDGPQPLEFAWDLDGDAITDLTTASPTLDWATLAAVYGFVEGGTYTISLTIFDGEDSDTATGTVYVNEESGPPEDPPEDPCSECEIKTLWAPASFDDVYYVLHGQALEGDVTENDLIPSDSVIYLISYSGVVSMNQETGEFTYTAPENFAGPITFWYSIVNRYDFDCTEENYDGQGNRAMVTIYVTNEPPIAEDDDYTYDYIIEGGKLTVEESAGLLANDTDSDDPHEKLQVSLPIDRTLGANAEFDPLDNETGAFTYKTHPDSQGKHVWEYYAYDLIDHSPEPAEVSFNVYDAQVDVDIDSDYFEGLNAVDELSEDKYAPFSPLGTYVSIGGGHKPAVKFWRGFFDLIADPQKESPISEGTVASKLEGFTLKLEMIGDGEITIKDGTSVIAAGEYVYGADGQPKLGDAALPEEVQISGKKIGLVNLKLTLLSPENEIVSTDSIDLVVYNLDVVIDWNNSNGLEPPLDDIDNEPGLQDPEKKKYIAAHDFDLENDEVPDYADGYNLDQQFGTLDDEISGIIGRVFTPVIVRISDKVDLDRAQLIFNYTAADPGLVARFGPDYGTVRLDAYDVLTEGTIRIWTIDGHPPEGGVRDKHVHYIGSGPNLKLSPAGMLPLAPAVENGYRRFVIYVEGINGGGGGISVTLLPYGDEFALIESDTDSATAYVAQIDADVDSDNNNGTNPDWPRNAWEDTIENDNERTGKIVNVNDTDVDLDGIVDYADGFDLRPAPIHAADDQIGGNPRFVPLKLEIPDELLDPTKVKIRVDYSDSDPSMVMVNADGAFELPDLRYFRIWKKDAWEARDKAGANAAMPGDYVPAGEYTWVQLGGNPLDHTLTLYVESVLQMTQVTQLEDRRFTFRINPVGNDPSNVSGDPGYIAYDKLLMTGLQVDLDVDSDNNNGRYGSPSGLKFEDRIEDLLGLPGKYVPVNGQDVDLDGIVDFADGFNLNPTQEFAADDQLFSPHAQFVPLVLNVPAGLDYDNVKVRLHYYASPPLMMSVDPIYGAILPPTNLRVWNRNAGEVRSGRAAYMPADENPGNFVSPYEGIVETEYTLSQLAGYPYVGGPIVLYMEGIRPTAAIGGDRITVDMFQPLEQESASDPPYLHFSDAVRVTVVDVVSVFATNAIAAEGTNAAELSDPGQFTISRGEVNTGASVEVFFHVDTDLGAVRIAADIDFDYQQWPTFDPATGIGSVIIPAGSSSVTLDVIPIDDDEVEWDEIVRIELIESPSYEDAKLSPGDSPWPGKAPYPPPEGRFYFLDYLKPITAEVTILDNDQFAGQLRRNVDIESTGLVQQSIANNAVAVGLQQGDVTLVLPFAPGGYAPTYRNDDNLHPIAVVETPLPFGEIPDSIKATLTLGGVTGDEVVFDLSNVAIEAGQVLRFTVLGSDEISERLRSGHYDYDIKLVGKTSGDDSEERSRTVRGSTEVVNRVDNQIGWNEFGKRWSLNGLDRLVFGDGISPSQGATALLGSGGDPSYFASSRLAPLGGATENGVALIRGNNTSGWFISTVSGSLATVDDLDPPPAANATEQSQWMRSYNGGVNDEYYLSTSGRRNKITEFTWTVKDLEPGRPYQVFATWVPAGTRADNAAYLVQGGIEAGTGTEAKVTLVDQCYTPGELELQGHSWRSLGYYVPDADFLSISLNTFSLVGGFANGEVIADAVMVVGDWNFRAPDKKENGIDWADSPSGSFTRLEHGDIDPPIDGYYPQPGDFTLLAKHGNRYEFNEHGLLQKHVDRNGNQTKYEYEDADDDGLQDEVETITVQGNLAWTYAYSGGKLEKVTDFAGREITFEIISGEVRSVTEPDPETPGTSAPVSRFTYAGGVPLLQSVQDANEHTTTVEYAAGTFRVKKVINADTKPWEVTPLLVDGLATPEQEGIVRKPASGVIGRTEDELAPPPGPNDLKEVRSTYKDPRGKETVYQTDAFGLVTALAKPAAMAGGLRDVWRWTRRSDGLPSDYLQPEGGGGDTPLAALTTTFYYDEKGNRTTVLYPDGKTESWLFNLQFSVLTKHTDRLERDTIYELDARGNAETIAYVGGPSGARTDRFQYTSVPSSISALPGGLITETTIAYQSDDAVTTTSDYFTSGRKVGLVQTVIYADGTAEEASVQYDYDSRRNRNSVTDELGRVTAYEFDQLDRLVKVTQPAPGAGGSPHGAPVTEYRYDAVGNQTRVYDPRSMELAEAQRYFTETAYDEMNRVKTVTTPAPGGDSQTDQTPSKTEYKYDASGNLERIILPGTRETKYTYDARNQNTRIEGPDPGVSLPPGVNVPLSGAPITVFAYDTLGNLKSQSDPRSESIVTTYRYDKLSRRTRVMVPATEDQDPAPIVSILDDLGRVTSRLELSPNGLVVSTAYEYDRFDRVTRMTPPADVHGQSAWIRTTYDLRGNVIETQNAKGQATHTDYDRRNRPEVITGPDPGSGLGRTQTTNVYDAAGQTETTYTEVLGTSLIVSTDYTYDALGRLASVTSDDPDGDGPLGVSTTAYVYDAAGNRVQTTVSSGSHSRATNTEFDNLNRPWKMLGVADTNGRPQTIYIFNEEGETVQTRESTGSGTRTTDYQHDKLGRLINTIAPANTQGERAQFARVHDEAGNLLATSDGAGHFTEMTYDARSQTRTIAEPAVNGQQPITRFSYLESGDVDSVEDPLNRDTSYGYDNAGRMLETRLPAVGSQTPTLRYDHDVLGNVVTSTDLEGNVTRYLRDGLNRVVQTLLPADAAGSGGPLDVTIDDGDGTFVATGSWTASSGGAQDDHHQTSDPGDFAEWRFTVTPGKRYLVLANWPADGANTAEAVFQLLDGAAQEAANVVDQRSLYADWSDGDQGWQNLGTIVVGTTGDDNLTVRLNAGSSGTTVADSVRVIEVGGMRAVSYDGLGRVIAETDELDRTTSYTYDLFGRKTSVTRPDPDGTGPLGVAITTYVYTALGNLFSETNPAGETTQYGYDLTGRRTGIVDPDGFITLMDYDLLGRQTSLLDAVGNLTTFAYDNLDQLVSETQVFDGGGSASRNYAYDLAGNRTLAVDRLGRARTFVYDARNQQVEERWYADAYEAAGDQNRMNAFTYAYDLAGRLVGAADNQSSNSYAYDVLDRITGETTGHVPGGVTLASSYARLDGLRDALAVSVAGTPDLVNQYAYDQRLRTTQIVQSGQAGGNLVGDKRVDFTYADNGRLEGIARYADAAGTLPVAQTGFGYDAQDRVTGISHFHNSTVLAFYNYARDAAGRVTAMTSGDGTVDYTYDLRGQLASATYDYAVGSPLDTTYNYDGNGNQTGQEFVTGGHNRPETDGTYSYEYDTEGNRTLRTHLASGAVTEYTWDHRNRLIRVVNRNLDSAPIDDGEGTAWGWGSSSGTGDNSIEDTGEGTAWGWGDTTGGGTDVPEDNGYGTAWGWGDTTDSGTNVLDPHDGEGDEGSGSYDPGQGQEGVDWGWGNAAGGGTEELGDDNEGTTWGWGVTSDTGTNAIENTGEGTAWGWGSIDADGALDPELGEGTDWGWGASSDGGTTEPEEDGEGTAWGWGVTTDTGTSELDEDGEGTAWGWGVSNDTGTNAPADDGEGVAWGWGVTTGSGTSLPADDGEGTAWGWGVTTDTGTSVLGDDGEGTAWGWGNDSAEEIYGSDSFTAEVTSATEGDNVVLSISLVGLSGVEYWVEDVSTEQWVDYSGDLGNSYTWIQVTASGDVYFPTEDDARVETTESFKIHLRPIDYPNDEFVLEADIVDNDVARTFAAAVTGATEGGSLALALSADGPTELQWWVVDVSATRNTDYTVDPQDLYVTGGTLTVDVNDDGEVFIALTDDVDVETTESFEIHVQIAGNPQTEVILEGDIFDNDGRTFDAEVTETVEGGNVVLALSVDAQVTLEYWVVDVPNQVSATWGSDYTSSAPWYSPQTTQVSPGSPTTLYFPTIDDSYVETRESFEIHVRVYGVPGSEIVLEGDILDNDVRSFEASVESATEGESVVLTLSADPEVQVEWWVEDVSAEFGLDYANTAYPYGTGGTLIAGNYMYGGPITFSTTDDVEVETTQSFEIHVRIVGYPATEVVLEADIFDNDEPHTFAGAVQAATEGGDVVLTLSSDEPVDLEYWVEDVSATFGADYTNPQQIYATWGTISVDANDDGIVHFETNSDEDVETTESFVIHVRIAGNPQSEILLEADILDDDARTFEASVASATEGDDVVLTVSTDGPTQFQYWVVDRSAVRTTDYLIDTENSYYATGGTFWADVEEDGEVTFSTFDDIFAERTKSFEIHVRIVNHPETEVVLEADILDSEPQTFHAALEPVTEGGTVVLTVSAEDWTLLEFWVEDVSAELGEDYASGYAYPSYGSTGVWAGWSDMGIEASDGHVYFQTTDDSDVETTESFAVHVRLIGVPESEVVLDADILDNDGHTFEASIESVTEGDDLVLSLSADSSVQLEYWFEDVSATYGADYENSPYGSSQVYSLAVDATGQQITLPTFDDLNLEWTESLAVHVRIYGLPATEIVLEADILDNDTERSFTAEVEWATEGEDLVLTVTGDSPVELEYWLVDVSTTAGVDYALDPQNPSVTSGTIWTGTNGAEILLAALNDSVPEIRESLEIHIRIVGNPLSEIVLEGDIFDDDARTFTASVEPVFEGSDLLLTISADGETQFEYWVEDVSTTFGADYSNPANSASAIGTVWADVGEDGVVHFTTVADGTVETTESFMIHVRVAGYPASEVVLEADILDIDGRSFTASVEEVTEGDDLALVLTTDGPVTLEYWVVDVSASFGPDYTNPAGSYLSYQTVLVEDGSEVVYFPTFDDGEVETTESLEIHVRIYGHPDTEVVLEADILDDDARTYTATIGSATEGGSIELTVSVDGPTEFEYWVEDVSATQDEDYADDPVAAGSVWADVGEDGVVTFSTEDDDEVETTESFRVHLRIAGHPETETILEADILDDDARSFTASVAAAEEGNDLVLEVDADLPVQIEWWVVDVSADYGSDYAPPYASGTLNLTGASPVEFAFPTLDDLQAEGTESFAIHLRISGYPGSELVLEADILDNDAGVPGITQVVEYLYDFSDHRIGRTIDPDGDGPLGTVTEYYVYDGNQILLRTDADGEVTNRYLWGPSVDQILADEAVDPISADPVTRWTLTDQLNSVRDLVTFDDAGTSETTDDTVAAIDHIIYDEWGKQTFESNPAAAPLIRFTGRPMDRAVGLQDNWHRLYDPELHQWLSDDWKGFDAGDANLQRYVHNDPVNFVDPDGMEEKRPFFGWNWWKKALSDTFSGLDVPVWSSLGYRQRPDGSWESAPVYRDGWGEEPATAQSVVLKQQASAIAIAAPQTRVFAIVGAGYDIVHQSLGNISDARRGDPLRGIDLASNQDATLIGAALGPASKLRPVLYILVIAGAGRGATEIYNGDIEQGVFDIGASGLAYRHLRTPGAIETTTYGQPQYRSATFLDRLRLQSEFGLEVSRMPEMNVVSPNAEPVPMLDAITEFGTVRGHRGYGWYGVSANELGNMSLKDLAIDGLPQKGNNINLADHVYGIKGDSAFRGLGPAPGRGGSAGTMSPVEFAREGGVVIEVSGVLVWDTQILAPKAIKGLSRGEAELATNSEIPGARMLRFGIVGLDSRGRLVVTRMVDNKFGDGVDPNPRIGPQSNQYRLEPNDR